MVQSLLGILPEILPHHQLHLLQGSQFAALSMVDGSEKTLAGFEYFHWENTVYDFSNVLHQIAQQSKLLPQFTQIVQVNWLYEDILDLLLEQAVVSEADNYLNALYGARPAHKVSSFTSPTHALFYRIPQNWETLWSQRTQIIHQQHAYFNLHISENIHVKEGLQVSFFVQHFLVQLQFQNKKYVGLLPYQKTEDVLYHLHHICSEFQIPTGEITVWLSGLIEEQSDMHLSIAQYFSRLQFDAPASNLLANADLLAYPPHYFTPFLKHVV